MVNRTIDRHPHEDHLLDDMIVWPDNPETAWYYEQVQEATNSPRVHHEHRRRTESLRDLDRTAPLSVTGRSWRRSGRMPTPASPAGTWCNHTLERKRSIL